MSCMSCSGGVVTRQPIQAALRAPIADSRHSQRPAQRQLTARNAVMTVIVHRQHSTLLYLRRQQGHGSSLISQRLQPRSQHHPLHIRVAALSLSPPLPCMKMEHCRLCAPTVHHSAGCQQSIRFRYQKLTLVAPRT